MSMCVGDTPVDDHQERYGLWVKREDRSCPGGPDFSKTRGVWAHIASRPEPFIGVLDTSHSQGGWAVARACAEQGRVCVNYYPVRKRHDGSIPPVQCESARLGARLVPLAAGMSAVLYHQARRHLRDNYQGSYMMPNALKLPESVSETAAELGRHRVDPLMPVLVSASSGTIAAGVLRGLVEGGWHGPFLLHMGYSRPEGSVRSYIHSMAGVGQLDSCCKFWVVDEGYAYKDRARPGEAPPFPCNEFYDLKAWRWWLRAGRQRFGEALFWNIG